MDETKRNPFRRAQWAIDAAISVQAAKGEKSGAGYFGANAEGVSLHDGYAEPGYDGTLVATGNWNTNSDIKTGTRMVSDDTMPRLARVLEKIGFEIEWHDEWASCDDCGKLVRTQPNSYCWTPSYHMGNCEIVCLNCLDPAEHLASLEGESRKANTIDSIDPADHGYKRLPEDYETGFHRGQDSDPRLVAKALEKQGIGRYLFNIDSQGQFDTRWSCYVHEEEWDLLNQEQFSEEETDGPSIAEAAERGLREASRKMADLPEGGIKYATIDVTTGTAEVRTVSHEEFVRGIK